MIGMIAAHVLPRFGVDGPTLSERLVSGRSAATFAVLAGVGVALATRQSRGSPASTGRRTGLMVRALLIGLLGLALGGLESGVAIILAFYAVFFLLLLPVLDWAVRRLLLAAGLVALIVPVGSHLLRPVLTGLGPGDPVLADLATPGPLLAHLLLLGVYPALPWSAYLLTGLAVGRLPLERPRTALVLLAAGAGLATAATLVSGLLLGPLGGYEEIGRTLTLAAGQSVEQLVDQARFGTTPTSTLWWLATDAAHTSTPPDLVATAGMAVALLGLLLLLAAPARLLLTPLAAVGSMPLTVYSLHVCFLAVTDLPDPEFSFAGQVLTLLIWATIWRQLVGRGPLEALLALMTRQVRART